MSYTPLLLVTAFLLVVATGIIMLVLVYQKRQLQYLKEKEQLKATFDKEILESKLDIQEQTMKNISQEIHDNIGQVLGIAKLNLNLMKTDAPMLQEKNGDTTELVAKAIHDLRNLSKSLDGESISERGLIKAIEIDFSLLKKTAAYQTTLQIVGEQRSLSHQQELILFRIFQEVMNNIIKHARASSVQVILSYEPQKFQLHIQDDGQGFDTALFDKSKGLGLRNLQTRSRLIGGNCSIDSIIGKGTTVKIELPMPL